MQRLYPTVKLSFASIRHSDTIEFIARGKPIKLTRNYNCLCTRDSTFIDIHVRLSRNGTPRIGHYLFRLFTSSPTQLERTWPSPPQCTLVRLHLSYIVLLAAWSILHPATRRSADTTIYAVVSVDNDLFCWALSPCRLHASATCRYSRRTTPNRSPHLAEHSSIVLMVLRQTTFFTLWRRGDPSQQVTFFPASCHPFLQALVASCQPILRHPADDFSSSTTSCSLLSVLLPPARPSQS